MLHFQKEYSFLVKYFKTINTFGQNLLEQTSFKLQTSSWKVLHLPIYFSPIS